MAARHKKQVIRLLEAASVQATELLIETMQDREVKLDTRLDCALEVLNRVYGKAQQIRTEEETGGVQIVLAPEVRDYAG